MSESENELLKQLENCETDNYSLKSRTLNSKAVLQANEIAKKIQQEPGAGSENSNSEQKKG